ncbi:MAG: 2-amino-4-hydroxy-6-hydroxymethyldihydropteridine diphosphokinase [Hyphomicrobiales bacterium]|nr:MAG: 2-amino-4-hydroxy-6-hydroxymethyldihydropteridine diphosphokinase [Hyphomicrobiales bacterium]
MPAEAATRAFLGLGGNIGDPAAAMAAALRALDAHDAVSVAAVSSLYRTPPWGVTDQPDFLNAVAAVDTALTARHLLDLCLDVERGLKRIRAQRWGPRIIDIDILLFGNERIEEAGLQVPHPRMGERAFVLAPLAEIAPEVVVDGQTATQRLGGLETGDIVRLPGGGDWWKEEARG